MPLESLQAMLPADALWPIGPAWLLHESDNHAATGGFADALSRRYGAPTGAADFVWKAEAQGYELPADHVRGEPGAQVRDDVRHGGVAADQHVAGARRHLFDYYLRPGGNYFGTKIGCTLLHALYDYGSGSVTLANASARAQAGLTVVATRYDLDGTMLDTRSARVDVGADAVTPVFPLPRPRRRPRRTSCGLTVRDAADTVVDVSLYWLSTVDNGGDAADLTGLQRLPPVNLVATIGAAESDGRESHADVTVSNHSNAVAMLVRLKLLRGDSSGSEVLPVFWDDRMQRRVGQPTCREE